MNITRELITDLWPVYISGEASPDSRVLVEEFLRDDPEFARLIRENGSDATLERMPMQLPPDVETRSLSRTRKLLQGRSRLRLLASVFTGLALFRVIEDAPWNGVSPQRSALTALVALGLWIVYLIMVRRMRSGTV
jgi:hypothetical protein